jgi:hypothetical protein
MTAGLFLLCAWLTLVCVGDFSTWMARAVLPYRKLDPESIRLSTRAFPRAAEDPSHDLLRRLASAVRASAYLALCFLVWQWAMRP